MTEPGRYPRSPAEFSDMSRFVVKKHQLASLQSGLWGHFRRFKGGVFLSWDASYGWTHQTARSLNPGQDRNLPVRQGLWRQSALGSRHLAALQVRLYRSGSQEPHRWRQSALGSLHLAAKSPRGTPLSGSCRFSRVRCVRAIPPPDARCAAASTQQVPPSVSLK